MIKALTHPNPIAIPSSGVLFRPVDGDLALFGTGQGEDELTDSTPPTSASGLAITVMAASLFFTMDGTEAVDQGCHELPVGYHLRSMTRAQLLLVKGIQAGGGSIYVEFVRHGVPGE